MQVTNDYELVVLLHLSNGVEWRKDDYNVQAANDNKAGCITPIVTTDVKQEDMHLPPCYPCWYESSIWKQNQGKNAPSESNTT